jgi:HSP20 family protein
LNGTPLQIGTLERPAPWYNADVTRRKPDVWFWQVGGDLESLVGGRGVVTRIASRSFWEPRIDLTEDENHYYLKFELSGVHPADVQLLYLPDSHSMLIKGVRKEEEGFDIRPKGCHRLEIYYGEFEREVPLPRSPIEPSKVQAKFSEGFLFVLIPKAKAVFRHTKVSIRKV